MAVLRGFRLRHSEIVTPGGHKSKVADRLYGGFKAHGWREKRFDTRIVVDEVARSRGTVWGNQADDSYRPTWATYAYNSVAAE